LGHATEEEGEDEEDEEEEGEEKEEACLSLPQLEVLEVRRSAVESPHTSSTRCARWRGNATDTLCRSIANRAGSLSTPTTFANPPSAKDSKFPPTQAVKSTHAAAGAAAPANHTPGKRKHLAVMSSAVAWSVTL
jgi:hypothetical protein